MTWLDDAFVGAGALLGGVGVYYVCPVGVWFYAGAWCVGIGYVLGLPAKIESTQYRGRYGPPKPTPRMVNGDQC